MSVDVSVELIQATVQVEQPLPDGKRSVGTGFLISDPTPDGKPRTVLVTANHVFAKMPGPVATIGFRIQNADGSWRYDPEPLTIRDGDHNLWTRNPVMDVAVIAITAPPAFAKAALPESWLAGDDTFDKYRVEPGDEMLALGYPQGFSANEAGFPILKAGRIASFPLSPVSAFPTFLLDLNVFPGYSGGPVFTEREASGDTTETPFIAGLITQEMELDSQNLSIGFVTHAKFIRQTLDLLDHPAATTAPSTAVAAAAPTPGMLPARDAAFAR
ncbi:MAG TPA: serine protease [Caulobacteraceae bacterium]|nr:serine protease [Caulobacteraceae bacterium]